MSETKNTLIATARHIEESEGLPFVEAYVEASKRMTREYEPGEQRAADERGTTSDAILEARAEMIAHERGIPLSQAYLEAVRAL